MSLTCLTFFHILVCLFILSNCYKLELFNLTKRPCLECICKASSACTDLKLCAKKSISFDYWTEAGSLTVDGVNLDPDDSFNKCLENEICILNTLDLYTGNILHQINDINCDGIVDCRDYMAAHMFGMDAKKSTSTIGIAYAKRFDRCEGHGSQNFTNEDWKGKVCVFSKYRTD